jgi:hypothetical protein
MELKSKRGFRFLAFASIVAGLVPYFLVVLLVGVQAAVRFYGFNGLDSLVRSVAVMCLCPTLGLWLGVMAHSRAGSGSRERRLSTAGLVLNGLNGFVLFLIGIIAGECISR